MAVDQGIGDSQSQTSRVGVGSRQPQRRRGDAEKQRQTEFWPKAMVRAWSIAYIGASTGPVLSKMSWLASLAFEENNDIHRRPLTLLQSYSLPSLIACIRGNRHPRDVMHKLTDVNVNRKISSKNHSPQPCDRVFTAVDLKRLGHSSLSTSLPVCIIC